MNPKRLKDSSIELKLESFPTVANQVDTASLNQMLSVFAEDSEKHKKSQLLNQIIFCANVGAQKTKLTNILKLKMNPSERNNLFKIFQSIDEIYLNKNAKTSPKSFDKIFNNDAELADWIVLTYNYTGSEIVSSLNSITNEVPNFSFTSTYGLLIATDGIEGITPQQIGGKDLVDISPEVFIDNLSKRFGLPGQERRQTKLDDMTAILLIDSNTSKLTHAHSNYVVFNHPEQARDPEIINMFLAQLSNLLKRSFEFRDDLILDLNLFGFNSPPLAAFLSLC